MTEAEVFRRALIEGASGGVVLALIAFLLSKFWKEIAGRTLLATVLFAAAGAYLGFAFAFAETILRGWVLVELVHCIAFGALGLYGWRGNARWLALGYALASALGFSVALSWTRTEPLRRGVMQFFA